MFELQKLVNDDEIEIANSKRELCFEEKLTMFDEKEKDVIVYFLTDMILIFDENSYKLIKTLELHEGSLVKSLPDQKYTAHRFAINCKNGSVTFIADSKEIKKKMIKEIDKIIFEIKKKSKDREEALN